MIDLEKEFLESLYLGNGYTQREIARICEVNNSTIFEKIGKYNIPTKDTKFKEKVCIEKELLEGLYWGLEYNQREIGDLFNLTQTSIYNRMRRYNIPTRDCSEYNKGKNQNEKSWNWKGDAVGYSAVHNWVRKRKEKPDKCVMCNKKPPRDLANISGKYRRDIRDYIYVCVKCHRLLDRKLLVSRVEI